MKVLVYEDKHYRWRWTLIAPNGQKVAREAQFNGYSRKRNAIKMVRKYLKKMPIKIRREL